MTGKKIILTGDRPTGRLHLGHYVGSLANRVRLQDEYDCHFLIADYQVLGDYLEKAGDVAENVRQIALDWMSVGMDPEKSAFVVQSHVPQFSELHMYFSMLVSVARLKRNPTIKDELEGRGEVLENMSYGYLGYPVSQAADILLFKANLVPVGEDQVAHIEQTREIARRFNFLFGRGKVVFPEPEALVSETPRLPGLDEKPPIGPDGFAIPRKMSKSLGNAIALSDPPEEVVKKVTSAFTDPTRLKKTDPGHPEKCNIYTYYTCFLKSIAPLRKEECAGGKIGCVACKKELASALNAFLDPIRAKRKEFEAQPEKVRKALQRGTEKGRAEGEATMKEVKEAVGFAYRGLVD